MKKKETYLKKEYDHMPWRTHCSANYHYYGS